MKRVSLLFVLSPFATLGTPAYAATCPTGHYLSDDGECIECRGPNSFFCYDDKRYDCIDYAIMPEKVTYYTTLPLEQLATDVSNCYCEWQLPDCYEGNKYTLVGGSCVKDTAASCSNTNMGVASASWCNVGYYPYGAGQGLGNRYVGCTACTNAPAHAHYTGYGTALGDCPWECDAGYGRHGDTCEALCTAGATKLHVGPHVFNLYPDSACERPAIHIGLDGGTCCAHLEKGEVTGALHVRYNGEVYHTVY